MKEKGFDIIILSDEGYEELCAEIYFDMKFIAIITQEQGIENAIIEIDPFASESKFNCLKFIDILQVA